MKKFFSERMGYKVTRSTIQIESMDEDLRNSLWNLVFESVLASFLDEYFYSTKVLNVRCL